MGAARLMKSVAVAAATPGTGDAGSMHKPAARPLTAISGNGVLRIAESMTTRTTPKTVAVAGSRGPVSQVHSSY